MHTNPHLDGAVEWLGTSYRTILSKSETAGSMSVVDTVCPDGSGPPRHVHKREDETFIMLSGECEMWLEGKSWIIGPGDTAFVPRGKEHTFRVIGGRPSRHLVILTPGGFEDFFVEMGTNQYRIPEDMDKIVSAGARFNLDFTGPPLGAQQ